MYVAVVPKPSSRPAILLRESYRDPGSRRPGNRALANLSDWPPERIETLRAALLGDRPVPAECAPLAGLAMLTRNTVASPGRSPAEADNEKVDTRGAR